jgi:hypothetical protein
MLPGTHMHARTRTHAHTDQLSDTSCFSTATMIRERASILRYTYIARLVSFYKFLLEPHREQNVTSVNTVAV